MHENNTDHHDTQQPGRDAGVRKSTYRRPIRFSDADVRRVKDAADLHDVVAHYGVTLRNGRGSCPLCATSSASTAFSVSANGRGWNCFACGRCGDVVDLVMAAEGIGFPDAVRELAAKFDIRLDTPVDKATAARLAHPDATPGAEADQLWRRRELLRQRSINLLDLFHWVRKEVRIEARELAADPSRCADRLHDLLSATPLIERHLDAIDAELSNIEARRVRQRDRVANAARILERAVTAIRQLVGGGRG